MRPIALSFLSSFILVSSVVFSFSQNAVIDDFKSNPAQRWRLISDNVMGGVSSGQVNFKTKNGVSYAHLTGDVSTANNGGFVQIRRLINTVQDKDINGLRLIVRGNNQRYFMHLRTTGTVLPWQYYQAAYEVSDEWREVRLPLAKFERSGKMLRKTPLVDSIKSIAVVAFGRDHSADIQIREVGFY